MRLYTINNLDDLLLKLYQIKLEQKDFKDGNISKLNFWTKEIKALYECNNLNAIIKKSLDLTQYFDDFDPESYKQYAIKALLRDIAMTI